MSRIIRTDKRRGKNKRYPINNKRNIGIFGEITRPPSPEFIISQYRKSLIVHYLEKYPNDVFLTDYLTSKIMKEKQENILYMKFKVLGNDNENETRWIKTAFPDFYEIHRDLFSK